ncbi:MAG: R3H domain-containing nucleic acid-binding protein [Microgenomates group bacterium]|jgi:spoIIIJ-associated protein
MEAKVSEILENILGMLGLEGSFEVTEGPEEVKVTIEASDPGRLIGFGGETLDALQLIVNQIVGKQATDKEPYKRVSIDVAGWRQNKEADLERRARNWVNEVLESKEELELEPMPSWQRRVVHMVASETEGVESESIGEGRDRHLVIRPAASVKPAKKTSKKAAEKQEIQEEAPKEDIE